MYHQVSLFHLQCSLYGVNTQLFTCLCKPSPLDYKVSQGRDLVSSVDYLVTEHLGVPGIQQVPKNYLLKLYWLLIASQFLMLIPVQPYYTFCERVSLVLYYPPPCCFNHLNRFLFLQLNDHQLIKSLKGCGDQQCQKLLDGEEG